MSSQGLGRRNPPHYALVPWVARRGIGPLGQDPGRTLATDVYFGGHPRARVQIPYAWLAPPARARLDPPVNVAEVADASVTATARNQPSIDARRREWRRRVEIDSVVGDDAANLAAWTITYYAAPRTRLRALILVLNDRAETEIARILRVTQGTPITITGVPADWPDGATNLIVEGIRHAVVNDQRTVTWAAAPVIGVEPGVAGPWLGEDSRTDGTDVVPF